jgi:hypothetical protein
MSAGRAWLARTVAACAVGAAVSIFAATRTWAVEVQVQPAPQAPLTLSRSGAHFVPWLSALGLVGLAGTGALLATRGRWRSLVGVVIALSGLGVVAGGVYGLLGVDGVRAGWPLLCVPAGLVLAAGGALAAARGADWPALGERYERAAAPGVVPRSARRPAPAAEPKRADDRGAPEEKPAQAEPSGPSPSEIAMWDALDRGEDPSQ